MKLKVIIRCHGNEHRHWCETVMEHKFASCLQNFMALAYSLFKLKVIFLWQLNVEVYTVIMSAGTSSLFKISYHYIYKPLHDNIGIYFQYKSDGVV